MNLYLFITMYLFQNHIISLIFVIFEEFYKLDKIKKIIKETHQLSSTNEINIKYKMQS